MIHNDSHSAGATRGLDCLTAAREPYANCTMHFLQRRQVSVFRRQQRLDHIPYRADDKETWLDSRLDQGQQSEMSSCERARQISESLPHDYNHKWVNQHGATCRMSFTYEW